MPKITFGMLCYRDTYITSLMSLLNQEEHDIEVVIYDTSKRDRKLALPKDDRIRNPIRLDNWWEYQRRILDDANSDIVAFASDDDYWFPHRATDILNILGNPFDNTSIVYADFYLDKESPDRLKRCYGVNDTIAILNPIGAPFSAFNRKTMRICDIDWDMKDNPIPSDWYFWGQCYFKGLIFQHIKKPAGIYSTQGFSNKVDFTPQRMAVMQKLAKLRNDWYDKSLKGRL